MSMLDNWCCQQSIILHRIERCVGGDQLTDSWTVTGLIERSLSFSNQGINQVNTASTVAYFYGDEPFWTDLYFNGAGYYVEYDLGNGRSEFYRIDDFNVRDDPVCCKVDHYEAELTRVKKPVQCQ